MKLLVILCFVTLVGLSMAGSFGTIDLDADYHKSRSQVVTYPRGCIYIDGRCHRECEEGTHAYGTGCGYLQPEATCDNPNPELDTRGKICDYSACYCDALTVRDTATKKCVALDECPKNAE